MLIFTPKQEELFKKIAELISENQDEFLRNIEDIKDIKVTIKSDNNSFYNDFKEYCKERGVIR